MHWPSIYHHINSNLIFIYLTVSKPSNWFLSTSIHTTWTTTRSPPTKERRASKGSSSTTRYPTCRQYWPWGREASWRLRARPPNWLVRSGRDFSGVARSRWSTSRTPTSVFWWNNNLWYLPLKKPIWKSNFFFNCIWLNWFKVCFTCLINS